MTTTDTRTPCLVIICGEIDIATTGNLRDALTTALTRGPHIEADLSAVTFMDASGIGVLLAARRQAAEAGGSLTLRAPSAVVRRLTEILGLDEVLPVSG
jgi:anti-anti-sigma factor